MNAATSLQNRRISVKNDPSALRNLTKGGSGIGKKKINS